MAERIPPQNLEAEKSVLGSLMLDEQAFDLVQSTLTSEDFYKTAHRIIFETIVQLNAKSEPVDLLTVTHVLQKKQMLEQVGGATYLAEILESTLSSANIEKYAEYVAETSLLRKISPCSGFIIPTII